MSAQLLAKKVYYTGKVHTVGGRDGGASRSDDGRLDIIHSLPGKPGNGTNPEQLLAAGWSACFEGAMGKAATQLKLSMPADTAIDAEVDLCMGDDGFSLQARLNVSIPGLAIDDAQALVDLAHRTCPYSKALKDSIPVEIVLV